jgi:hypothetical protein
VIKQARPYPDIDRNSWRNGGDILPTYRQSNPPAEKLPADYHCALLRSDIDLDNMQENRDDYAGFTIGNGEPRPGCLVIRGGSLGETSADISIRPDWPGGARVMWQVRNFSRPTASELSLLEAQIRPLLVATIAAHRAELRANAIAGVRASIAAALAYHRKAADELEKQAAAALAEVVS